MSRINATASRAILGTMWVILGLYAGTVMAESTSKTSLFEALTRVSPSSRGDVVYIASDKQTQHPAKPIIPANASVKEVARHYGLDAVSINGVYVLLPSLPATETSMGRIDALRQWQDRCGGPDPWRAYPKDVRNRARALSEELGMGTRSYDSLTTSQKQQVDDLMRRMNTSLEVSSLNLLLYGHNFSAL